MGVVKKLVLVLMLLSLGACSTERLNLKSGRAITPAKLKTIEEGVTTRADIENTFGPPMNRLVFGESESYFYKDVNLRSLYIEFGPDGVVTNVVSK